MKWFRLAAEQGYAPSQFSMGSSYVDGCGVEKNLSEAKKWLGKAAAQGHEQAVELLKELR